jgi:hypothetical protein
MVDSRNAAIFVIAPLLRRERMDSDVAQWQSLAQVGHANEVDRDASLGAVIGYSNATASQHAPHVSECDVAGMSASRSPTLKNVNYIAYMSAAAH